MREIRTVVVGVDGSEGAQRALAWATDEGVEHGATVVAVHALGLVDDLDGRRVPSDAHRDEIGRRMAEGWCAALVDALVDHRLVVCEGSPVMAVLGTADEAAADLVVVGRRGSGGFPGLSLGSTSAQVAQHSTRPVLIVP